MILLIFLVIFLVLFFCYVAENDKIPENTRGVTAGIGVGILVLYIVFGIFLG